jgi:hypothetical protein
MEGTLAKRTSNRASFQKRWFAADSKTVYIFKDSLVCFDSCSPFAFIHSFIFLYFIFLKQAPFPLEKIALGSSSGGWQVTEDEEGGGYQFVLKTPHTDGIHYFEAESKADKTKWIEVLSRLTEKLDSS